MSTLSRTSSSPTPESMSPLRRRSQPTCRMVWFKRSPLPALSLWQSPVVLARSVVLVLVLHRMLQLLLLTLLHQARMYPAHHMLPCLPPMPWLLLRTLPFLPWPLPSALSLCLPELAMLALTTPVTALPVYALAAKSRVLLLASSCASMTKPSASAILTTALSLAPCLSALHARMALSTSAMWSEGEVPAFIVIFQATSTTNSASKASRRHHDKNFGIRYPLQ